jgi:hypothetical protein
VRFGVVLAGFVGMVRGVQVMAMRDMRVVPGLFVLGGAMMFGGLTVMLGGGLVVFGRLVVMLGQQACVHDLVLLGAENARAAIGHKTRDVRLSRR